MEDLEAHGLQLTCRTGTERKRKLRGEKLRVIYGRNRRQGTTFSNENWYLGRHCTWFFSFS